jgi:hypothetical protein
VIPDEIRVSLTRQKVRIPINNIYSLTRPPGRRAARQGSATAAVVGGEVSPQRLVPHSPRHPVCALHAFSGWWSEKGCKGERERGRQGEKARETEHRARSPMLRGVSRMKISASISVGSAQKWPRLVPSKSQGRSRHQLFVLAHIHHHSAADGRFHPPGTRLPDSAGN